MRKVVNWGRWVEEKQGCEDDGPYEDDVDYDVDWVAVVSAVECEVLLEIEQSHNAKREFLFR